ncbi:unnamed protein product [Linum tenue]|uniref:Uncharacterized protein n=1 Tax=Linum tenue TaxID=586396 RepID=A0AAV0PUV6_9ROSI|nr:unnamed protein product [Linum tenue]
MEDEKKKKRNKKKKNKQNKASEDDAPAVAADHVTNGGNDHKPTIQIGAVPNVDANSVSDVHRDNGLDESGLEEKIKELQDQNNAHVQKQASLEGAIKALISANDISVIKQADFEEKNKQLSIEKDSYMQKETDLEMKIAQLQHEKDSWLEKEYSSKETIVKQNVDITRLKMQVVELEENKSNLLKENQVLVERISDLQSRILTLDTSFSSENSSNQLTKNTHEDDKVNSQIEAALALVDKLITENAELVEKVNELYAKLDQKGAQLDQSSGIESDGMVENTEILGTLASPAESVKNIPALNGVLDSIEMGMPVVPITVPSEADSGEIVQIPLDETEDENNSEAPQDVVEDDSGDDNTPFSDAPLIGAPFRLISFVASYVSGADLVNRS